MKLVRPSVEYRDSYLVGLHEFRIDGICVDYDEAAIAEDFEGFVQRQLDDYDESKIPVGHVPYLRLWAVHDGEFVGHVTIRCGMNEDVWKKGNVGYAVVPSRRSQGFGRMMLVEALARIERMCGEGHWHWMVLVVCGVANTWSRKIAESCGGRWVGTHEPDGSKVVYLMPIGGC